MRWIILIPTINDIHQAAERIQPYAHRTPILTSTSLNQQVGAEIFLKCENLQKVGAFKFRGACNAIFSLSQAEAAHGVITHSSGNHGQAVALAAQIRGIPAYVVMPHNAPEVKKAAIASYGGKITFCEPTLESREETQRQVAQETGASIIHPYNDDRIITGQGTAALELLQEVPDLDIILTPVGGGGLLSGTSIAAKSISPQIQVIGAEPQNADDAYRSLMTGKRVPSINPQTIADGLRTSLGDVTFPILQQHVEKIVTVSEENILSAMKYIWERVKIVIEPSSAVPVGALWEHNDTFAGLKVGIILTGGNVDLEKLPWSSNKLRN